MSRVSIPDFALANPIYAGASVSFFTVSGGAKTAVLATLYAGTSGATQLANPQILDSDGKFSAPVYHDVPVIASVSGLTTVDDHDTGIIFNQGLYRGTWVTGTVYYPNDVIRDGANGDDTKDLYRVISQHTSGTWATDKADATKLLISFDISDVATALPTPADPADDDKVLQASGGAPTWGPVIASSIEPVLSAASLSAARTAFGLAIGSDVQAFNALLADIAGLTVASGDILYVDGSSDIVNLAKGTDGQFLTLASGIPAWAVAPSGWEQIGSRVSGTTNVAELTITDSFTGYDVIRVAFRFKLSADDMPQVQLRQNSNYVTSGYDHTSSGFHAGNGSQTNGAANQSALDMMGTDADSGKWQMGHVDVWYPNEGTGEKVISGVITGLDSTATPRALTTQIGGVCDGDTSNTIDGIKLLTASSGEFDEYIYSVWGWRQS